MKKVLMAMMVTAVFSAQIASAAKVIPADQKVKGLNEPITIQHLENGVWGYTYESRGYTIGTGKVSLIPVTREAARTLQSLDKTSSYNCVIQNSTFVNLSVLKDAYYVLDINCN